MFKSKIIEAFQVKISIYRDVLEAIYDECDKSTMDETGGRIVGYYHQNGNKLDIEACGVIGPGPNARRSPTSFFQDGEYQEAVFREIEAEHPEIEHLGNWHTHHVNGLDTLSSGDIDTYERIVNHENHNTDFFYALLVVAKNRTIFKRERYLIKHFLLKRKESLIYEIPSARIKIVHRVAVFIDKTKAIKGIPKKEILTDSLIISHPTIDRIRARDKENISEMYAELNPFLSKQTKSLYWKGKIKLVDSSFVEIFVLESIIEEKPSYSITLSASSSPLFQCHQLYLKRTFDSAWKAIYLFERDLNREIFEKAKK